MDENPYQSPKEAGGGEPETGTASLPTFLYLNWKGWAFVAALIVGTALLGVALGSLRFFLDHPTFLNP